MALIIDAGQMTALIKVYLWTSQHSQKQLKSIKGIYKHSSLPPPPPPLSNLNTLFFSLFLLFESLINFPISKDLLLKFSLTVFMGFNVEQRRFFFF